MGNKSSRKKSRAQAQQAQARSDDQKSSAPQPQASAAPSPRRLPRVKYTQERELSFFEGLWSMWFHIPETNLEQRLDEVRADMEDEMNARVREITVEHRKQRSADRLLQAKRATEMRQALQAMRESHREQLRRMKVEALKDRRAAKIATNKAQRRTYFAQYDRVVALGRALLPLQHRLDKEMQTLKKFEGERGNGEMLRIVLYSPTGQGKSTFANRLMGDESDWADKGDFKVSHGVQSETACIQKMVLSREKGPDQPGVHDSGGDEMDRRHANNLVAYLQGIKFIHAICLVKNCNTPRLSATYQSMIAGLEEMLGTGMWKHVVIVMTGVENQMQVKFDEYSTGLKQFLKERFPATRNVDLPVLGMSNFYNWEEPCRQLVDEIVPRLGAFHCEHLFSPLVKLQELVSARQEELNDAAARLGDARDDVEKGVEDVRECERRIQLHDLSFNERFEPEPLPLRGSAAAKRADEDAKETLDGLDATRETPAASDEGQPGEEVAEPGAAGDTKTQPVRVAAEDNPLG